MLTKKQVNQNADEVYRKIISIDSDKIREEAIRKMNDEYENNEAHKRISEARKKNKIK